VPESPSSQSPSSVVCSQCGGENELTTGQTLIACSFCSSTLFVDRSEVVSHYRLAPLLGEPEAKASLRRWMSGNDTVKDLDRKSQLESVEMASFPVWLFRVSGDDGEHVYVEPAAPTLIPYLTELSVPAGRLEAYRAEDDEVEVIDVTVPLATARGWLEQRNVGEVTETALVRMPFWRCRYRYDVQSYLAAVDASTGSVLAAVYPEKSESPYFLVAALGLILFGLEGLVISNLAVKLVVYIFTAIPLTGLAYWVARKV
jgi:DNA-directed RNA polymerase subunit RPC12/RpoP